LIEMDVFKVLRESFLLLLREPKLFLPKLLVSFLFGVGMLAIARLLMPFLSLGGLEAVKSVSSQLPLLAALLAYTLIVFAVDVFVNALYPVLVKQFNSGQKISFSKAAARARKKFVVVFPAVLVVELAMAIVFSIFSTPLLLSNNFSGFAVVFGLFLLTSFVVTILFYVIYPIGVLREKNFVQALSASFKSGISNAKVFALPSLIPFIVSLANFALAFSNEPISFFMFWVLRFLIAIVATYHMVVNPSVYLALRRGMD